MVALAPVVKEVSWREFRKLRKADDGDGHWVTIKGRHIFIDGEGKLHYGGPNSPASDEKDIMSKPKHVNSTDKEDINESRFYHAEDYHKKTGTMPPKSHRAFQTDQYAHGKFIQNMNNTLKGLQATKYPSPEYDAALKAHNAAQSSVRDSRYRMETTHGKNIYPSAQAALNHLELTDKREAARQDLPPGSMMPDELTGPVGSLFRDDLPEHLEAFLHEEGTTEALEDAAPQFKMMANKDIVDRIAKDPKAVEDIEYATGDIDKYVAEVINSWARTSADADHFARALQLAANREFDLGLDEEAFHNEITGSVTSEMFADANAVEHATDTKYHKDETLGLLAHHEDAMRAVLKHMYQATQDSLAKRGIKSVDLYRGVYFDPKDSPEGWPTKPGTTITADVNTRPISSFSVSYETAHGFSLAVSDERLNSYVMRTKVPAKHILSTPRSGLGCLVETEVTVLRHPIKARVKNVHATRYEGVD